MDFVSNAGAMEIPCPVPAVHPAPWRVVGSGIVALAVAMGIGRFAFTPLLPLMLRDGTLTVTAGAEWAAANYAGYLAGALTASVFTSNPLRGLRLALAGVAVTTIAVGAIDPQLTLPGAVLRALAGVCSAWALVCASGWCLADLARRRAPELGAWIYTGVGLGIASTGLFAWLGGGQPARWLWLELGLLAAVGAVVVAIMPDASPPSGQAHRALVARGSVLDVWRRHWALLLCYGAFGLGYIVPATFLPVMARALTDDPLVFGLTWPLFGFAAAGSVAASARWLANWPRRRVWALAQGLMALGTALALGASHLVALAVSAVLVGGTFMVATMAGLQLARELEPDTPTPLLAAMTVAFAIGQIAGPVTIRLLGPGPGTGWDALSVANATATLVLAVSSLWLWRSFVSRSPS